MKKDSYWFKHDSTASRDLKLMSIKVIYDFWGIGVFWTIIEFLREQSGYKFEYTDKNLTMLCSIIGCKDEVKFNNFIHDCLNYNLFEIKDNYLISNRLVLDMINWESKKNNGSEAKQKRNESEIKAKSKRNRSEIETKRKHKSREDKSILDINKKEIIKEIFDFKNIDSDKNELWANLIDKWLEYKKEKNETYKPKGLKQFIKSLIEMSGEDLSIANKIIDNSMCNNYSGIFRLKNAEIKSTKPIIKETVSREW